MLGDAKGAVVSRLVIFAVAYAVAVAVGRASRLEGTQLALVWPAAAVAVLWLALSRSRAEKVAACVGLYLTGGLGMVATGTSVLFAAVLGVTAVALAVTTVEYLSWRFEGDPALREPADLTKLIEATVIGNVVGAALIAGSFTLLEGHPFVSTFGAVLTRNGVSTALGLALWMVLRQHRWDRPRPQRVVEGVLTMVGTAAAYWLVFWVYADYPLKFTAVALSAWIALRFSTAVGTLYTLAAGVAIIVITLMDRGVFVSGDSLARALLVQGMVGGILVVVLLVTLHRDSRDRAMAELDAASWRLQEQNELLEAVLDSITDAVVVVDADGTRSLVNSAAADSGIVDQVVDSQDGGPAPEGSAPLRRAQEGFRVDGSTVRVRTAEGDRVLSVNARPLSGWEGSGTAVGVFRDVTDERRAARRLRETRDLFAGVLDAASEQSIIGTDAEGWITVFNVGAERMLGVRRSEMLGRSPLALHRDEEVRARAVELGVRPSFEVLVKQARRGITETREWTYVRRDGSALTVSLSVSAMRDADDEVDGFILVGTDITERLRAERSLAESEERFRLAFDTAPVGMYIYGVGREDLGRITRVNTAMTRFVGRSEESLVGRRVHSLAATDQQGSVDALVEQLALQPGEHRTAEVAFRHADGSVVWGAVSSGLVAPSGGTPYGICLIEDVTSRKEVEAELRHQALHDTLTGLANRALLADRLELALAAATRSGRRVGMLVLDLDGFKAVNDEFGHAEGDELLRAVAARLQAAVRPGDTLARVGGDEFAIVSPEVSDALDLELMAERLAAALREPYSLPTGNTHSDISASVGVAVSDEASDATSLLQAGDQAMYAAKRHGKDRIETYERTRDGRAARLDRLRPELRRALAEDEFVLFGQPIIDLTSGEVVAVETLIRWQHPQRGLLLPSEFLDVLEGTPDMAPLGRRVLRESCRMAAQWQRPEREVRVHVNVSGRQLESAGFRAEVEAALEQSRLAPGALVLELTETHASIIPDSAIGDLGRLREDGIAVAIDDIGTGYSSLARLTELPVDVLKIDRQFIAGLAEDNRCEAIVRGVIGIGEALGIDVVAEGIEEPRELHRLREWGCQMAQGFLLGRPVPERDLRLGDEGATVVSFPTQGRPPESRG